MAIRNTYKTYERLKREQHIDTLFRTGKAFSVLQLKFLYQFVPRADELSPVRAAFSIPKKKFRKSVQRHRARRLLIEAWRMNKQGLYEVIPADMQLHVFVIFTGVELPVLSQAEENMKEGIARLIKTIAQNA